jgi:stearoyl-CoA desaturase (delta-9 desaturase)
MSNPSFAPSSDVLSPSRISIVAAEFENHSAERVSSEPLIETIGPKRFSWLNASVLFLSPVAATVGLIYYIANYGVAWSDVLIFISMYLITGLSITAGYHRYFAHRTYGAHPLLELFYLCFGAASVQNSVLSWASDHRFHHRYVDQEADPYNIQKGFFWAHMGWILFEEADGPRDYANAIDLKKNPRVMWQHRNYTLLIFLFGLVLPTLVGWCFGRPMGGFIWGCLVRTVVVHHATFLINSAAHVFGDQPHSEENSGRDSWWLAFFSFGEGYHNFHHTFAGDYRNGIAWYHWDPSKWMIRSLTYLGLTFKPKVTPQRLIDQHFGQPISQRVRKSST